MLTAARFDHGIKFAMSNTEEMAISKFKATCLAVLERVRRTGRPVLITRFGKPVAEIVPPRPVMVERRKLGTLAGEIEIVADIVGPIGAFNEDETLREWDKLNRQETPARHARLDMERQPRAAPEPRRRMRHRKPAH